MSSVDTRVLSRAEVAKRVPEARGKWVGGTYSERDGKTEPALAEGARTLGATIHQGSRRAAQATVSVWGRALAVWLRSSS